jgi:hypothetical protein
MQLYDAHLVVVESLQASQALSWVSKASVKLWQMLLQTLRRGAHGKALAAHP